MNAPPLALPGRVPFARVSRRTRLSPAASQLWWLRPAPLVLCVIVPLYLSFMTFDYENVVTRRYVPSANYFWGLLLLVALALGASLASSFRSNPPGLVRPAPQPLRIPGFYTASLLIFTLTAYVVWFGPLLNQLELVTQILNGERDNLRGELQTLPGVTTLTQCGVAYVVLVTIKRYSERGAMLWERAGVWMVVALAMGRAFLWSERLAVLEVLVPMGVTAAAFYRFRSVRGARLAVLLPLIGPIVLFFAFAGTEYFRSWRFYQNYYDSIWQFSYERLMTYYAVATNSGVGLLEEMRNWPQYTGRFVFEWAWSMPKVGKILIETFGDTRADFSTFLLEFGEKEFNNPSGLFPIVYDVGYFGSAIYFLLVGAIVGFLRRSYVNREPAGLMFYPFCVLFILELLRFNYLAASRFIPAAGSLIVAILLHYELPRPRQRRRSSA